MKKIFYLLYIIPIICACNAPKKVQTAIINYGNENNTITESSTSLEDDLLKKGIVFLASGNEPFWSLTISADKTIHFKTLSGINVNIAMSVNLPSDENDVIKYVIDGEDYNLTMQLKAQECVNDMSGVKSDYTVIVDVKKKADKIYTSYNGCGYYLKDYRLNDIWVLENINTQALSKTNFVKGFPLLEINFAQKKMFGNTGCNEVNGFMEVQGNKIKFGKLITTYNFCPNKDFEENYLNHLSNKTIPYKLQGNGKLQLQINKDSIYYYKKID